MRIYEWLRMYPNSNKNTNALVHLYFSLYNINEETIFVIIRIISNIR